MCCCFFVSSCLFFQWICGHGKPVVPSFGQKIGSISCVLVGFCIKGQHMLLTIYVFKNGILYKSLGSVKSHGNTLQ